MGTNSSKPDNTSSLWYLGQPNHVKNHMENMRDRIQSQASPIHNRDELDFTRSSKLARPRSSIDVPSHFLSPTEEKRSRSVTPEPYRSAFFQDQVQLRHHQGSPRGSRPTSRESFGQKLVAVATYTYTSSGEGDISFIKGDKFEVLSDTESEWWFVENLRTGDQGYIPSNYVANEKSILKEDWFFDKMCRKETVKLLMSHENPPGTYLVRISERTGEITLSIKNWDEKRHYHIRHYKIFVTDDGVISLQSSNRKFYTPHQLIEYYTKKAHGLCHALVRACPKPKPQVWDLSPEHRDQWEINCDELQKQKLIGKGGFGEVFSGVWRGKEVAIKVMKPGTMSKSAFLEEARIMKTFRHEKIVSLYAVCSQDEHICIVQELMSKGSLLNFLKNSEESRYHTFPDLLYIAQQIASGMEYLESKNLIHRDLAARNVLMDENNIAKICDFGLARVIESGEYLPAHGTNLPIRWTSPEGLGSKNRKQVFSVKSDVWAYGILLMEIFTLGEEPYPGMSCVDIIVALERCYRMPKPDGMEDQVYQIMLSCWLEEPDDRPNFSDIKYWLEQIESLYT